MPAIVDDVLFRDPAGRPKAIGQFILALGFLALYVFATMGGSSGGWLLVMTISILLSGIAESLPTERRRLAGLLRFTALLALTCLIAMLASAPEVVF